MRPSGGPMTRIAVITHEFDRFERWRGPLFRRGSSYMLFELLKELKRRGHSVRIIPGTSAKPEADIAVLHVDATVTPPEYVEYARAFPFCVNIGAADISKRRVSGALIGKDDDWQGPVIVKSNLNNLGMREQALNRRSLRAGKPKPFPGVKPIEGYRVYTCLSDVAPAVFDRDDLVVEKFIPEPESDGFGARFWIFCGDRERCTRHVSPQSLVKGDDTIRHEPVPVPDELRALRRQLGFDYGKFDFVMHEGRAVLLDANKTPGGARNLSAFLAAGNANLADGFEGLIGQVT